MKRERTGLKFKAVSIALCKSARASPGAAIAGKNYLIWTLLQKLGSRFLKLAFSFNYP